MSAPGPASCAIPHCPYVPYKAGLCRKHWGQVPYTDRAAVAADAMTAAHNATEAAHAIIRRRAIETLT